MRLHGLDSDHMEVQDEDITVSNDKQDVTLRVGSIEIDELDSWEPTENQKHIKMALRRRSIFQ